MMRRHAIIAGTNKAGTTSLFRYLSDHPDVCPSKIKETNYFESATVDHKKNGISRYLSYFDGCPNAGTVYLEASPKYMALGRDVALRIHAALSDVKLIFILREPASRILSYFLRNKQTMFHAKMSQLELDEFVALVEDASKMSRSPLNKGPGQNAYLQFKKGCYVNYLDEYSSVFDRENICILFFDDFVSNPHGCIDDASQFLGLDSRIYDNYTFQIENKTRKYRFSGVQHIGSRINVILEPLLNKFPGIRRSLRSMLTVDTVGTPDVDHSLRERLVHLYQPHNIALAGWIGDRYPKLHLPTWLQTGPI